VQVERAVWPLAVVVVDEDTEHVLEVGQSRHSERMVRTKQSAIAFAS
jgi:hypothetical protein